MEWKFIRNENRLKIIIPSIIILLFLIVIYYSYSTNLESNELESVITVESRIIRVNEEITLLGSESKGEIERYIWDFSDGTLQEEMNPKHAWSESGWYNVTLTVENTQNEKDLMSMLIGVQQNDQEYLLSESNLVDFNPSTYILLGEAFTLGPNIRNPEMDIEFTLIKITGEYSIRIGIEWWPSNSTNGEIFYFYEDNGRGVDENIDFSYQLPEDDIPPDAMNCRSIVFFFLRVDTGHINNATIYSQIQFPMEIDI